ncbi:MAG: mannose-1-phosphate guanylyltransferase [Bacteroidales bacterium]|nr:mannose-1-phosphate guanylyltransferase [Bacteroidales bacterium]
MSPNSKHNYCIIMAGGGGAAFWPVARESLPKQFIPSPGGDGKSFLARTYERYSRIFPTENIFVVTLARFRDKALAALPGLKEENLLLEPYSRNTAPCIAYAAYTLLKKDPEAMMVVSPSDLVIREEEMFFQTIADALEKASGREILMSIGIIPTRPETGFGYIQALGGNTSSKPGKPLKVKTFTEKPDAALAEVFFRSGEFFWNSGIVISSAETFRSEMERFVPEVTRLFVGWEMNLGTPDEKAFIERAYADCPKVSIDYGVMEKTDIAWIYPARFGWDDVSSWSTLYDNFREGDEPLVFAPASLVSDSPGTIIYSTVKGKMVAVKGLEGFAVVDTPDALLICPKDDPSISDLLSPLVHPKYKKYR